jgi:hypothetical protein
MTPRAIHTLDRPNPPVYACVVMRTVTVSVFAILLVIGLSARNPVQSLAPDRSAQDASNLAGAQGFDFEIGTWRVHHRVKRPAGDHAWYEFDGTSTMHTLMDGSANIEDNTFYKPGGVTHGVALRAYDTKNGQWAIWWIDGRDPHGALDPPVKGRFENGVGTFYSDGTINGKPTRTRFIWSQITPTSARWEQAFSLDAGMSWDTNWIMEFQRVGTKPSSPPSVPN